MTGKGPRPTHRGPQGKSDVCEQRYEWKSDQCGINVFGAFLEEGFAEKKLVWPAGMHGYLRRKRREDSELVHERLERHTSTI